MGVLVSAGRGRESQIVQMHRGPDYNTVNVMNGSEREGCLIASGILQADHTVVVSVRVDSAHILRSDEHILLSRALPSTFNLHVSCSLVIIPTSMCAAS